MKLKQRDRKNWIWIGKELVVSTDFWHFLFPSKTQIQRDASSWYETDQEGRVINSWHISYTLRNYLVHKFYKFAVLPSRRFAERLGVDVRFASQLGAIAFDATSGAQFASTGSPVTQAHTCTGSNLLLFALGAINSADTDIVTGITYNAVSMTRTPNGFQGDSDASSSCYMYYLAAPDTGANNISMSFSGINRAGALGGNSYTGCSQTSIPDSDAAGDRGAAGASPFTLATTVVATNCWLTGHFYSPEKALSAGTGTTARTTYNGATSIFGITCDSNGTVGTGSQSLQATWTDNSRCMGIVASFAPPAAFVPLIMMD